jgi:cystine transport system substrate-binding protein
MRRVMVLLVCVCILALMVVGCGSSTTTTTTAPAASATTAAPAGSATTAAVQAGDVMARIKKSGVMKVGFEGAYQPFNFLNDKQQLDGFDVDVSNEIAKRLGAKAEFVTTQFDALVGGLQADKWDIVIAQMSITDKRKQQVDFTQPYVRTGAVLIIRTDEQGYKTLADLKGKKVGTGAGTTFADLITAKAPDAILTTYKNLSDYLPDLLNGRLDVIVNDPMVIGYQMKTKNLPVKISSDLLNEDLIGMAIKKGNADFVKAVDDALSAMKADGTYKTIYMKWFTVAPPADK